MKIASTITLLSFFLIGAAWGTETDFIDKLQERLYQLEQENNTLQNKSQALKLEIDQLSVRQQQSFPNHRAFLSNLNKEFTLIASKAEQLPVTPLFPGRLKTFLDLTQTTTIPAPAQLHQAISNISQLINDTEIRSTKNIQVVQPDGSVQVQPVTFAGPFTAVSKGNFLIYKPATDKLLTAPHQPDIITRLQADDSFGSSHLKLPIDPGHGSLLASRSRQPSLWSQVKNSGLTGWLIIILGITAITLSVIRLFNLNHEMNAASWQKAHPDTLSDQNILGRIMLAWHSARHNAKIEAAKKTLRIELLKLQAQHSTNKFLLIFIPVLGFLFFAIDTTAALQSFTAMNNLDHRLTTGMTLPLIKLIITLETSLFMLGSYFLLSSRLQKLTILLEQQVEDLFSRSKHATHSIPFTIQKAPTKVE